jgi:hypothetical protein
MYQNLSLQDPPKFTQIGIFGLKIYHLATLFQSTWMVFQMTDFFCFFWGESLFSFFNYFRRRGSVNFTTMYLLGAFTYVVVSASLHSIKRKSRVALLNSNFDPESFHKFWVLGVNRLGHIHQTRFASKLSLTWLQVNFYVSLLTSKFFKVIF